MTSSAFATDTPSSGPPQNKPTTSQAPTSPRNVQTQLTDLRERLNIQGSVQEKAWEDFAKASGQQIDMTIFQEMAKAKTTPALFGSLEKMQTEGLKRFAEQKKVILKLYDSLDAEQKKAFDQFVFSTMMRLGAGMGVPPRPIGE